MDRLQELKKNGAHLDDIAVDVESDKGEFWFVSSLFIFNAFFDFILN